MAKPPDVKFMKSHEWARKEETLAVIGVSDFAVDQLNREIVFVELPDAGREVKQGQVFGVIEAVKAASDLFAPVGGKIVEVNSAVVDNPLLVAEDPYGKGWLVKIEPSVPADWENLLGGDEYETLIQSEESH